MATFTELERKSSTDLSPGDLVLTTPVNGDDFGLPLVDPIRKLRGEVLVEREVRGSHRAQGGTVVWFVDGTKSRPLHGRTTWACPGN